VNAVVAIAFLSSLFFGVNQLRHIGDLVPSWHVLHSGVKQPKNAAATAQLDWCGRLGIAGPALEPTPGSSVEDTCPLTGLFGKSKHGKRRDRN
jgi:hypothetical protein